MQVTASIGGTFSVTENLVYGLASQAIQNAGGASYSFANGTGSAQIDLHFEKKGVTLAAGASVTYTLSALTDDLGRTVALQHVKSITIHTTTRTAGDTLAVGNAASHPWGGFVGSSTSTYTVYDLDEKVSIEGVAVTTGSADQLKITNAGSNSITFDFQVTGTSV